MIPKVIHYCWFGRNPLPKMALKCIASWRKFFPGYEIKEWNEDNFDVNMIQYTRDAYAAKKYAFVSDYARFWILYHYGGIYFDTDVEVIRSMDDIIEKGAFMGLEISGVEAKIAPGLGLASSIGNPIYEEVINGFSNLAYLLPDGKRNPYSMIPMVTDIMLKHGLKGCDEIQDVDGIYVYAPDFFNPLNDANGRLSITANTRAIHWFMKSWMQTGQRRSTCLKRIMRRVFGDAVVDYVKRLFK